tara:strand:- start:334 stop:831 length:498 start_codon:yes stop_codon:yes gene_type:complete
MDLLKDPSTLLFCPKTESTKMKIQFQKVNASNHELKIIRANNTTESTILHTNTYLLHDICHYFVEKELNTLDGFWGMLSHGYRIEQLFGKTNQLTKKLRIIECIVGATQSVYSNHMDETGFWNYIQTVDFKLTDNNFLEKAVPQISQFMTQWNYMPAGQTTTLHF